MSIELTPRQAERVLAAAIALTTCEHREVDVEEDDPGDAETVTCLDCGCWRDLTDPEDADEPQWRPPRLLAELAKLIEAFS
jgi:hypothetical protein